MDERLSAVDESGKRALGRRKYYKKCYDTRTLQKIVWRLPVADSYDRAIGLITEKIGGKVTKFDSTTTHLGVRIYMNPIYHSSQVRIEVSADSAYALEKIVGDREILDHDEHAIIQDIYECLRFLPTGPNQGD